LGVRQRALEQLLIVLATPILALTSVVFILGAENDATVSGALAVITSASAQPSSRSGSGASTAPPSASSITFAPSIRPRPLLLKDPV
jgi:hypothetical protein